MLLDCLEPARWEGMVVVAAVGLDLEMVAATLGLAAATLPVGGLRN